MIQKEEAHASSYLFGCCFFLGRKGFPFAAVETVDFFRSQEELFYHPVLRVKFHKFTVEECIEAAKVRTHAVSGQFVAVKMEGEILSVLCAGVAKARSVQPQNAAGGRR